MGFDLNIKDIKLIYCTLTGKDTDVILTFKGTSFGVTKCWHIRCDQRELNHETYEGAAISMLSLLKKELADKIAMTEKQTAEYKKLLISIEN